MVLAARQAGDQVARGRVPYEDGRPIEAGCRQKLAVGTVRYAENIVVLLSSEPSHFSPCRRVPDCHGPISAPRSDVLTVRAEGYGMDRVPMLEGRHLAAMSLE